MCNTLAGETAGWSTGQESCEGVGGQIPSNSHQPGGLLSHSPSSVGPQVYCLTPPPLWAPRSTVSLPLLCGPPGLLSHSPSSVGPQVYWITPPPLWAPRFACSNPGECVDHIGGTTQALWYNTKALKVAAATPKSALTTSRYNTKAFEARCSNSCRVL
ncbi:unnamed protein product [Boreogadus saida]